MEADISIWRKPGHFYFALTGDASFRSGPQRNCHFYIGAGCSVSASR